MKAFDRVIKNGTIVTATDTYRADIGISEGKIAAVGVDLNAEEIIDAEGKYIFPGGIDVHTHLDMQLNEELTSADDFETGSIAAAIGGTTSFIDYACQPAGGTLREALEIWKEKGRKSCLDYSLHIAITRADKETLAEMEDMVREGITSFKVYLVYDMRVNDEELLKILEKSRECGALITVHCENYYVIRHLTEELLKAGKTEPKYHPISRPASCEGEAVNRVVELAAIAGAPVYIVHNTCRAGVKRIKEAQENGQAVLAETCPQYLFLTDEVYEKPDFEGAKYVMSPPLRKEEDTVYLWEQLKNDTLQVIATDHCPFSFEEKKRGRFDFSKIPNGGTGIEERMPLLLSEGPKHGLTLNRIVELTSLNPAKIFGMYPRKGTIVPGSDADLVLYDPKGELKITKEALHENVDYTVYEGISIKGCPVMTLSRGEIIVKAGVYVGDRKRGKFIKREKGFYQKGL
ncbi:MAG: dihydropyrimidinase [Lachnospiraceae bacterium]